MARDGFCCRPASLAAWRRGSPLDRGTAAELYGFTWNYLNYWLTRQQKGFTATFGVRARTPTLSSLPRRKFADRFAALGLHDGVPPRMRRRACSSPRSRSPGRRAPLGRTGSPSPKRPFHHSLWDYLAPGLDNLQRTLLRNVGLSPSQRAECEAYVRQYADGVSLRRHGDDRHTIALIRVAVDGLARLKMRGHIAYGTGLRALRQPLRTGR